MSFKIIQITKINAQDFTFLDPENVSYPVSPLISAKFYTPKGQSLTLKIRATLYINSKDSEEPSIRSVKEKDGVLKVKYQCNFSKKTPETCNVWYIEIDYTSETVSDITKIISFLRNSNISDPIEIDPETSRGTEVDVKP
jgi:hypothetical protein